MKRRTCQKCKTDEFVEVRSYKYPHYDSRLLKNIRFYYKCHQCNKKFVRDICCQLPDEPGYIEQPGISYYMR